MAEKENFKILHSEVLTGGDINQVYRVKTENRIFVIKTNENQPENWFEAEANGLKLLAKNSNLTIPEVMGFGNFEKKQYLMIDYIPPEKPTQKHWENFAIRLAKMHRVSQPNFGLNHDNFIGSLPQQNNGNLTSSSDFYIQKRILPQLNSAKAKGFTFKHEESFLKQIPRIIPNEKPSLTHGDLWSGNYFFTSHLQTVLIDPAVSFSLREFDLAMLQLFGSPPTYFFETYNEENPLEVEWKERIHLFQLYYLLVHLNLFGSSYYPSCTQIINRY
ncbi:fructosamine kinase family protein [Mesonia sp. K7]|uniref:fructosamine kinase family protein n=1 Tax=Mesonia sp. K7 TaxID=2218606 RepID=UPI00210322EE|nr:fructosamine kinase family protein [Mesonia sp. K7]